MQIGPEHEENGQPEQHAGSGVRRAEHEDERGEAQQSDELWPLGPAVAREGDRRQRREDGDDRAALRGERRGDDERRDARDDERAQQDDPGPAKGRVRAVPDDLSEPLVDEDRQTADGPRERVHADESLGQGLATLREMPEEIGVADGRERRQSTEDATRQQRDRPRHAAAHGRPRTIHRPSGSAARTVQPSSRSATASGRAIRRTTSLTR